MNTLKFCAYERRRSRVACIPRVLATLLFLAFLLLFAFACGQTDEAPTPQSASITSDFQTEYFEGDVFVPSGRLRVYYDFDYYTLVDITADMVSGFDTSKAGTVIVTVSYAGVSATEAIHVSPLRALSLTIDEATIPSPFFIGASFPRGVMMTAQMSNGSEKKVEVTPSMVSGFDSSTAGAKTIVVGYARATQEFSLIVEEDTPQELILSGARTDYSVGDSLDTQGATLTVVYKSGRRGNPVDLTAEMISAFSTALGGDYEGEDGAVVEYDGLRCSYDYHVAKTAKALEIVSGTLKQTFEKDEAFPSDARANIVYDDKTKQEITLSAANAPDFDTSEVSEDAPKRIALKAEGVSVEYEYFVLIPIDHALLIDYETPVEQGKDYDRSRGKLRVFFDPAANKPYQELPLSDDDVEVEFSSATVGKTTLRVRYRTETLKGDVIVCPLGEKDKVKSIKILGSFSPIKKGENLKLDGLQIAVDYEYREEAENKQITNDMIKDFVFPETIERSETVSFTVEYEGATARGSVLVVSDAYAETVTSLQVFNLREVYVVGKEPDFSEAMLSAVYGEGYEIKQGIALKAEYVDIDTSTPGRRSMTITYEGYTSPERYDYRVITQEEANVVSSIWVTGFSPLLFVGDSLSEGDFADSFLNYTLAEGFGSGKVPLEPSMLSDVDTSSAGDKEIAVTYQGRVCYISVTVHPKDDREKITSIRVEGDIVTYVGEMHPDFSDYELILVKGYGLSEERIPLSSEDVEKGEFSTEKSGFEWVPIRYKGLECDARVAVLKEKD